MKSPTGITEVQRSTITQNELMSMLLFSCFQFEEKFIQSPEDLEKLRKGNTRYLYDLSEEPQGRPV